MTKKLLTIAIGGGGINIINYLYVKKLVDSDFLAIDTDLQSLTPSIAGEKILIGERGLGFKLEEDKFSENLAKIIADLREKIPNYKKVIVILCLGGNTGTRSVIKILRMVQELNIPSFTIGTYPFGLESKHKIFLAAECIGDLQELNQEKYILKNDDLLQLNKHHTLQQMFSIQNEEIARKINSFI